MSSLFSPRHLCLAASTFLLAALHGPAADAGTQDIPDPGVLTAVAAKPASVKGEFVLISVGDLINARPVVPNPHSELARLIDIVKAGDVAIGNQEGIFFDLDTFKGHAPGSPYNLRGEPELAEGLKSIGIDMVSTANNHASDWDTAGLQAMTTLLDDAGVVHAGDGKMLADARAARYFETPKGRVALIATASTFKQGARAQDAMETVPARPGISTLRLRNVKIVSAATMDHLRAAGAREGSGGKLVLEANTPAGPVSQYYRMGPEPRLAYEMNTFDHFAILNAIREGKAAADLAVFTIHAHENARSVDDTAMQDPADFLVRLSREAIDVGADVVMAGGPHSMRGVEIYKGKPIFYGLAVFLFNGNVVLTQDQKTEHYGSTAKRDPNNPADGAFRMPESWDDGFTAATTFQDGRLKEVRLYPLDHGRVENSSRRGTGLSSPTRSRKILESLQAFSTAYGTKISIEGSVGVIRP
ncbi:CapA family protein [Sphingosinicella sp.]|uniref:CapA family protein n=1 Tax=Sphingosinicella sp. TaxID=1917971 RepID=UPI0035B4E296